MEKEEAKQKIILSDELQKSMMKFFMKTSIPRKAREERMKKTLSEKSVEAERQEEK
ncbi:MAG: hypothetical protein FWE91_04550 [Defluviitaleaceae bacterium]|nr:hypothetical protein [Defluviitaleaceae bacterium]